MAYVGNPFDKLVASGNMSLGFVGFIPVGESHSVAIGDTVVFGCKTGFEFFDDDHLMQTIIHLPCTPDGSLAVPETWPSCVPSKLETYT